jgi:hypothetical protein
VALLPLMVSESPVTEPKNWPLPPMLTAFAGAKTTP